MKFVILSRSKIDSVESNLTDFIAEDLISSIEDEQTMILCGDSEEQLTELVSNVSMDNPHLCFKYEIIVERK